MESRLLRYLSEKADIEKSSPLIWDVLSNAIIHPKKKGAMIRRPGDVDDVTLNTQYNDDTFTLYLNVEELFTEKNKLNSVLWADFDQPQHVLAIVVDIYDVASGTLIDTQSHYYENVIYEACKITSCNSLVQKYAKNELRVEATFVWINEQGKAEEGTVVFEVDQYYQDTDIIESINVSMPRAKDGVKTIVLYDREPWISEETDYHYVAVMVGKQAMTKMPFAGSVTVAEGFEILGIWEQTESELPQISLVLENGCGVKYSNEASFASQCTISDDKRTLSWEINENWNAKMDLSHFIASTVVDFSCTFTLKVGVKKLPGYYVHPKIMISSTETPQPYNPGSGVYEIEKINIIFGCVAEDTMILMSDGSTKNVSEVKPGDYIWSDKNAVQVKDIVVGPEKELSCMVTTDGKKLRATSSHPVKTPRGLVPISELHVTDMVVTVDGEKPIRHLYTEKYDGRVYNFVLEPEGEIICNGIVVGDFAAQNRRRRRCEVLEVSELQQEFRKILAN